MNDNYLFCSKFKAYLVINGFWKNLIERTKYLRKWKKNILILPIKLKTNVFVIFYIFFKNEFGRVIMSHNHIKIYIIIILLSILIILSLQQYYTRIIIFFIDNLPFCNGIENLRLQIA